MKNRLITIITPTYNRADRLAVLYDSLCKQTNDLFSWLVVDDGSTDNTKDVVHKWIEQNKIEINYIYKNNGGKHTALNVGIKTIETELTFIVDSDDYLTSDAIDTIINDYEKIDCDGICGIAYLRQSKDGHYLTNKLVPTDGIIENFCECRYKRSISGDMAEVWLTHCLKEFPFPEFPNEKFVSEDIVWIQMSKKYKMIFYNKAIYISDYLEGGLTNTRRENNKKSPKAAMYRGEVQLEANLPFKFQIRAMLYYIIYGRFAEFSYTQLFKNSKKRGLFIICVPAGIVLFNKWRNS